MDKYGDLVRFVCVYVMEAHASDQWPLGNHSKYPQHKTIEDRINVALQFQQDFQYRAELYVDTIENTFNNLYSVWPERGFVVEVATTTIQKSKSSSTGENPGKRHIRYISDPQLDGSIDWLTGITHWLENFFGY